MDDRGATAVIDVQSVSFAYAKGPYVLNKISLTVCEGGLTAIVGASGSGKSTLLRLIAGILSQRSGILHGSLQLFGTAPDIARRSGEIGYVFQDYKLLPFLSVHDNLRWSIEKMKRSSGRTIVATNVIPELLGLIGLPNVDKLFPHHLSGGMKARIAIARALVGRPKLLLIDEAFSSLDVGWRTAIYRQLRQIREQLGTTIVYISHDLLEACEGCDQIIVLSANGSSAQSVDVVNIGQGAAFDLVRQLILFEHPSLSRGRAGV